MRHARLSLVFAALLSVAVLAVGCGSSNPEPRDECDSDADADCGQPSPTPSPFNLAPVEGATIPGGTKVAPTVLEAVTVTEDGGLSVHEYELPQHADAVVYAFGQPWLVGDEVRPFDVATGEPGEAVSAHASHIIATRDELWLASLSELTRMDGTTGEVTKASIDETPTLAQGGGTFDGRVFLPGFDGGIYELNPSGKFSLAYETALVGTGVFAGHAVVVDGYFWISAKAGFDFHLLAYDLRDGSEVAHIVVAGPSSAPVAANGRLWVLGTYLDDFGYYTFDPTGQQALFTPLAFERPTSPVSLGVDREAVWIAYQDGQPPPNTRNPIRVVRIAGETAHTATLSTFGSQLVLGGGAAWVAHSDEPVLERISP